MEVLPSLETLPRDCLSKSLGLGEFCFGPRNFVLRHLDGGDEVRTISDSLTNGCAIGILILGRLEVFRSDEDRGPSLGYVDGYEGCRRVSSRLQLLGQVIA